MGSTSNGVAKKKTKKRKASKRKSVTKPQNLIHVTWGYTVLCLLAMIGGPLFIYWCWICVEYNKGKMLLPNSLEIQDVETWFWEGIIHRIRSEAVPTIRVITVYLSWLAFQAFLFWFGPGPVGYGVPLPDGSGKRLPYKFNGQFAWVVTLIAAVIVHKTGLFPLTELYDDFPKYQTMQNICTYVVTALVYLTAVIFDCGHRMTDSIIYNYFMGAQLNPRIGGDNGFDVKYYFELRPGIMCWFFTTIAMALKQYDDHGYICFPMVLICFGHLCFVNACYKGEQCVPHTIDIKFENFGWMLCFLDLVMVPCIFPINAYFLYIKGPFEHSLTFTVAITLMHIIGYWMFDTANSQKDYFRENLRPKKEHIPKGFPRLPWDELKKPDYIQTERGTKLLTNGWWRWARHLNYTGDIMMSWAWGLICGTESYFPYAYTTYLTPLLIHRDRRDDRECRRKYGKYWDKYCAMVPYRLIPYVY